VEVSPFLTIFFSVLCAAFCALSIDARQRIFRAIAVVACLAAGPLLLAKAIGIAVAAMAVAVFTLFFATFLTVRWQCLSGAQPNDLGNE
jgi:ABC-type multidrug transport system permease subunit